ncbi:MAG: PAS domain S-box protein [Promethearchaeota archaeon]
MEFSKDRFIQIIENIKECYFEVDLKGTFTYFNDSLCKITGYSREELEGLNYKYLADEENMKNIFKGFNSVYRTGVPLTDFEYQFKNKDGEKIIGETSVYLKYDSKGNKIGFYGIFRDVTKRKEEQEKFKQELEQIVKVRNQELRESEEKYSNLFHHSNDAIFLHDLEGNIIDVNQKALDQFGYTREEILNLKIPELHPKRELEASKKAFEEIAKKGVIRFEISFQTKNGKIFLAEVSSSLFDVGGKQVIQGIVRDITVRVLTEKMLKESEDKYHQLFNKAPYPIILFDLEGNILDCNDATINFLSTHTLKDYIGRNYREFWSYHEKNIPLIALFYNIFTDIVETGKTLNFEFPIHRTIGGIIWCYATASKINIGKKKFIQIILMDISAQKEAQQSLKESEEKYRNLVENAHEGVWAVDENDDTIFVNPKICEMLGYTRDEIMSKNLHFFLEDSMIKLINSYRNRREMGLKDTYELEFIKKDGTILSTSINAAPILNEDGEFKGSFAFINDITNRKIAEQKLKESEEKYRIISENANDLITITNIKLRLEYINEQVHKRVMGYTEDDLIGTYGLNLIHPDDRKNVLQEIAKTLKTGRGFVEARIRHKDGRYIWTETGGSAIKDKNGELKILLITRVIDERKKTEQKLKESEERYRNLIESVPFSIALIDQQGKIVYCNPSIEKLLGYSQEELIGYKFGNLPVIYPKYVPSLVKRFQKVLKGEILPPLEIELYKKDKSLIWIRYQTSLVKLGNEVLVQAVINDITEQKKADLLIEEEIIKLKELDQIRKDLISRVSHELKTPLVSVCGAAELLLDLFIEEFKDDTRELIEMIEKGGKRLKYLVDNLVDITRIEYKKFKLEKDIYDFSQMIRDCARELMYLIKKRELNLELDLMDDIFLEFDKIRIEQVILNLLSNAIKNTPPNGKIIVKSLKRNNCAEIAITDSGIGLTKEEMDRLFTRFGKIERYGDGLEYIDIQGSGLGLYISKEIIDLHKGYIWVESEGRNKGSTFTIKLPIQ